MIYKSILPIFHKGLEEQNDWNMIFESIHFLYELAEKLQLGNRVTELGLILFHNFLAKVPVMTYNTKIIAAASLYLACKLDSPRPSDFFIEYTNNHRNPKNPEVTLKDTREKLFLIESKILVELDFDLEFELPRTYYIMFNLSYRPFSEEIFYQFYKRDQDAKDTFEDLWSFFMVMAGKILNDTFYSPLCLYYHPAEILGACLIFSHTLLIKEKLSQLSNFQQN